MENDQQTQNLQKFALLQHLQQQGGGGAGDTEGLVHMLGQLYGIQQQQQKSPAELDLLKAHANYYGQLGEDRPEERQARAMQLELSGLDKAYAYDPTSPEYHQARKGVLQKYGYNLDAPATGPKPQGEFGAGTPNPALTIPKEYENDPAFTALQPKLQQKQQDVQLTAQDQAAKRRQAALSKLRQSAGVDETIMSGIPGYLH